MGEINCHCHVEQTNQPSSVHVRTANISEKPKQQSHKKTKSRVNSIISPRQIIGLHSKTNSTTNINLIANSHTPNTHSAKLIPGPCLDDESYPVCKNNRKYMLEVGYNRQKYEAMVGNEVVRVGAVTVKTGKYDIQILVKKQYEIFGIVCRLNKLTNTISVKDSGMGLGVFQYIQQDQVLEINTNQQVSTPYIVLDIGVGKFMLIKRKPNYHLHKPSITYSLITNTHQLHKIPKSLPSRFDVGEDYQQYQSNNKVYHNSSVQQGQTEIIENKVKLQVIDNKIKIKAMGASGMYRYLAEYQELSHGQVLRCGVCIYDILMNQDTDVVFKLSPR